MRLKDAFVEAVQIATIARQADAKNHLQAVKYLIYTTLYQQLVRNAFYRGDVDGNDLLPPAGYAQSDLRQRIITHLYDEQQKKHVQHALLATMPQLPIPDEGLQKPLIANWELYEQLAAAHPQWEAFTTQALAEKIYAMLSRTHKYIISVSNTDDMYRYLLILEHMLLPIQLAQNLPALPVSIDGSDNSIIALQRAVQRSRVGALLVMTEKMQFTRKQKSLLYAHLITREGELQKQTPQATRQWYEEATAQLDTSKDKLRQDFIRKVLISARHADNIEKEATDKPVNLAILRKALLHSLFVMDFSGEVQNSINTVLRQQDYHISRKVFFQEVHKHLTRLSPKQSIDRRKLAKMSHDDIVSTYIKPALAKLEEHEQETVQAIARTTKVNHIAQLKALLQYGYWFGYFSDYGKDIPTLARLPLDDRQRANYLRELKFVYLDEYPFLLLEKNGKQLYEVLAAKTPDEDLQEIETEELWPVISQALAVQYAGIKSKMVEIDRANSLQDIKYLAAGSPMLNLSMKEFDGLYPLHQEFVKRQNKPSKFQHNWETVNMDYIGNFFMVMIGHSLGSWLLRRAMFGKAGSHVLSVLDPLFGGAMPYTMPLLHGMWGVILLEYFVAMPYHTFVVKPQKLKELQEYYQLGGGKHNLISSTELNYYRQERNGHFLNYAFEMGMHALFVGWWVYHLRFSHLLPKLRENNLQKLLKRLGINSSVSGISKSKNNIFKPENIKKNAQQEIDKLDKSNNISRHYKRERIHQIKTAEQKLLTMIADKQHALKVAAIEHKHNFKALGLNEAVFDFNTIARAYGLVRQGYKTGVYNAAQLQEAEVAMQQLQMTLMRRLKISPLRVGKDKIAEETYQRALGEAVAESMFPERNKKALENAVRKFYQAAGRSDSFSDVEKLFEGQRFVGFRLEIKHATPDEMSRLLKHIKTIGFSTKDIKSLEDVRKYEKFIADKKSKVIVKFTVSPGMKNDTPHKKNKRDKLNEAWANIEHYLKRGYFKGGG